MIYSEIFTIHIIKYFPFFVNISSSYKTIITLIIKIYLLIYYFFYYLGKNLRIV